MSFIGTEQKSWPGVLCLSLLLGPEHFRCELLIKLASSVGVSYTLSVESGTIHSTLPSGAAYPSISK
jgi:hypothetical protein